MKFFFPDGQDLVDPFFDFEREIHEVTRRRQRDDCYPHEMFKQPPYDGILVSKAVVEARYSFAQRQRLFRQGVREFLRLSSMKKVETMGDCGAFSYKDQEVPPFAVDDVLNFYGQCDFDYGISVDHVILSYNSEFDYGLKPPITVIDRQRLTLQYATEFFKKAKKGACRFRPVGVAQGWSPNSYAYAVEELQKMGYSYIAIGGLVPMKTLDILKVLETVNLIRKSRTRLHLLGITRCENINSFHQFGAASFDSTSPLVQAFKSDNDNYHTEKETFIAVRVPQVEGNTKLKASILSGKIDQDEALRLERDCLQLLKKYDHGKCSVQTVLEKLLAYEKLHDGKLVRRNAYERVLRKRPWEKCPCAICTTLGIQVVLFRGSERNRRRGFHNLHVFHKKVSKHNGNYSHSHHA